MTIVELRQRLIAPINSASGTLDNLLSDNIGPELTKYQLDELCIAYELLNSAMEHIRKALPSSARSQGYTSE